MSKLYEGQKLVNDTWIIVIGRRKDKDEVIRLLKRIRTEDSTLGGLIAAAPNKNARLRVVTYARLEVEEI